ncbi:hypothetical protein A6770_22280 [Nostoc minutum NIES-26]|uniref:Uncharacterized protein n=1 Tax=Nostoc minutum NIES-26 TaxID=1844469 RepID=A0A367QZ12_9NOSO|nr:hypothetical protein A6770_22280 [Nostoc minutum NIES-26]
MRLKILILATTKFNAFILICFENREWGVEIEKRVRAKASLWARGKGEEGKELNKVLPLSL